MLFVLGFLMGFGGIALVLAGDLRLADGRKVPQGKARKAGILLLAFWPLLFACRYALYRFDPDELVPVALVNWSLAVACLVGGLFVLHRAWPKGAPPGSKQERVVQAPGARPVPSREIPEEPLGPGRIESSERNPFDFS
jgi:drug/metabolite transporter (DMT)-like permease